jgi:hypothetical protein
VGLRRIYRFHQARPGQRSQHPARVQHEVLTRLCLRPTRLDAD